MTIEYIHHCDGPDCETSVKSLVDYHRSFVYVKDGSINLQFCSWDCVIKYGAKNFDPVQRIEP